MKNIETKIKKELKVPTIIEITHEGKKIKFAHPNSSCFLNREPFSATIPIDPWKLENAFVYIESEGKIKKKKLNLANNDEFISLLYAAYKNKEFGKKEEAEYFKRVNKYFFNNITFWSPSGIYMMTDSERYNIHKLFTENEEGNSWHYTTEKFWDIIFRNSGKIENINGTIITKDKKFAFVPKEKYRIGEHTIESFVNDGLTIALSRGITNAMTLGEIIESKIKLDKNTKNYKIFISNLEETEDKMEIKSPIKYSLLELDEYSSEHSCYTYSLAFGNFNNTGLSCGYGEKSPLIIK